MVTTCWRRACVVTGASAAAMLLAGCGTSADPQEVADAASRYTSSANPAALDLRSSQSECRAKIFLESDLSERALKSVRAGREPRISTPHDAEAMRKIADVLANKCLDKDD